jgi:hypothetical protein
VFAVVLSTFSMVLGFAIMTSVLAFASCAALFRLNPVKSEFNFSLTSSFLFPLPPSEDEQYVLNEAAAGMIPLILEDALEA